MAWVRFTADFDWKPTPRSVIAYKAGHELSVTKRCADAAVAAGKAEAVPTPSRAPPRPATDADGEEGVYG